MRRIALIAFACVAAAAGPRRPLAAEPQPTDIAGVTAELAYMRQYDGVLHAGVLLRNTTDMEVSANQPLEYSELQVVSPKANKKYFPLKDADGNYLAGPIQSRVHGGRWDVRMAPHSETLVWVLFDALPAGSVVNLEGPIFHSFDGVAVTEGAPPPPTEVASSLPPLRARLVSVHRAAGQMKVRLMIVHPAGGRAANRPLNYADVYALDGRGKRSYPLLKDSKGLFLASPLDSRVNGGRFSLYKVKEGGQQLVDLTFQAPPDSVRSVDIVVPWFAPFEAVAIEGAGGAAPSGRAVAGGSADLERALKELNAAVTEKEVKVNLAADLLFDFDKADIKPAAEPELMKVVAVLKSYPDAKVLIEGHTDGKGRATYNQRLSELRAATVADWLIAHTGRIRTAFRTRGWGMSKPIAPNTNPDGSDNPEGRAKNRRVEITVTKGT